jgi:FHS family L-fucose permease-like MFS transporter
MTQSGTHPNARMLLWTTYFIYFFCGLTLCFDNLFNPDFRNIFGLSYRELMYTKPAFAVTGLVFPVLAGLLSSRLGYKKCLSLAMFFFAAANVLVLPALHLRTYPLLLCAMFVMGMGFNLELVAGNPLMAALGKPETASSRVNLGNAMGAVAQIIPPLLVAFVIFPSDAIPSLDKIPTMQKLFFVFAAVLFITAFVTTTIRDPSAAGAVPAKPAGQAVGRAERTWGLFAHPHLILGFLAIFLAIGVEAGFQGLYLNYLQDAAGVPVTRSLLWQTVNLTVFALGRLLGSFLQKKIRPAKVLTAYVIASTALLCGVVFGKGLTAVLANTLAGFFYCIFFPTLYTMAIEGLGDLTPKASGFLIMGLSGISVIPVVQGAVADKTGLQASYAIGFLPWAYVFWYAIKGHRIGRTESFEVHGP